MDGRLVIVDEGGSKDAELRTLDDESSILLLLAKGVKPKSIFGVDGKIQYSFPREQTSAVLDEFLLGGEVSVEAHKFFNAMAVWKANLAMLKTMKREAKR